MGRHEAPQGHRCAPTRDTFPETGFSLRDGGQVEAQSINSRSQDTGSLITRMSHGES